MQETTLHPLSNVDNDDTHQKRHGSPSDAEEIRLTMFLLKDIDDNEMNVEETDEELDADINLLQFEVIAIETKEKLRKDSQVA